MDTCSTSMLAFHRIAYGVATLMRSCHQDINLWFIHRCSHLACQPVHLIPLLRNDALYPFVSKKLSHKWSCSADQGCLAEAILLGPVSTHTWLQLEAGVQRQACMQPVQPSQISTSTCPAVLHMQV